MAKRLTIAQKMLKAVGYPAELEAITGEFAKLLDDVCIGAVAGEKMRALGEMRKAFVLHAMQLNNRENIQNADALVTSMRRGEEAKSWERTFAEDKLDDLNDEETREVAAFAQTLAKIRREKEQKTKEAAS